MSLTWGRTCHRLRPGREGRGGESEESVLEEDSDMRKSPACPLFKALSARVCLQREPAR